MVELLARGQVAGHELLSGGVGAALGDRGHSGRQCLHVLGRSGPNRATRRSCCRILIGAAICFCSASASGSVPTERGLLACISREQPRRKCDGAQVTLSEHCGGSDGSQKASCVSAWKLQVSRASRPAAVLLGKKLERALVLNSGWILEWPAPIASRSVEVAYGCEWRWWAVAVLLSFGWACCCQAQLHQFPSVSGCFPGTQCSSPRRLFPNSGPSCTTETVVQTMTGKNLAPQDGTASRSLTGRGPLNRVFSLPTTDLSALKQLGVSLFRWLRLPSHARLLLPWASVRPSRR